MILKIFLIIAGVLFVALIAAMISLGAWGHRNHLKVKRENGQWVVTNDGHYET